MFKPILGQFAVRRAVGTVAQVLMPKDFGGANVNEGVRRLKLGK